MLKRFEFFSRLQWQSWAPLSLSLSSKQATKLPSRSGNAHRAFSEILSFLWACHQQVRPKSMETNRLSWLGLVFRVWACRGLTIFPKYSGSPDEDDRGVNVKEGVKQNEQWRSPDRRQIPSLATVFFAPGSDVITVSAAELCRHSLAFLFLVPLLLL